jgi:hypothetical protein
LTVVDRALHWLESRLQTIIKGREVDERDRRKGSRDIYDYLNEKNAQHAVLLAQIKKHQPELEQLLKVMQHDYEDGMYRLYHYSFKVYQVQETTQRAVALFKQIGAPLDPWNNLCDFFEDIVRDGTGRGFRVHHNRDWLRHTGPIVEAFLHARYFVEMMLQAARELETAPDLLPSGWACVLELYEVR